MSDRQLPNLPDGNPQSVLIVQELQVCMMAFIQSAVDRISDPDVKPLTDEERDGLAKGLATVNYTADRIIAALQPDSLSEERWNEVSQKSTFKFSDEIRST